MHRLGSALYDPFARGDDYIDDVRQYGDGVIQIDTRSFIEWWIYMYGSFEGSAVSMLGRMLGSKSVAVDVGANVGVYTLTLARKCAEVHAFEPHPDVRYRLTENVRLNNLENVLISPYALSDTEGEAVLYSAAHANQGQASLEQRDDLVTPNRCRLQTLDNYVTEVGLTRLDLVKVDVEGAEFDVLRGGAKTLATMHPMLYVEVNPVHLSRFGSTPEMVRDYLHDLGYQIWVNLGVERSGRKDAVRLKRLEDGDADEQRDHYWLAIHPRSDPRPARPDRRPNGSVPLNE